MLWSVISVQHRTVLFAVFCQSEPPGQVDCCLNVNCFYRLVYVVGLCATMHDCMPFRNNAMNTRWLQTLLSNLSFFVKEL